MSRECPYYFRSVNPHTNIEGSKFSSLVDIQSPQVADTILALPLVSLTTAGMKSLLSLLSSEFPTIQALALTSLVSCMNDGDCRARLRDAGGLSTLVSFLGNKV